MADIPNYDRIELAIVKRLFNYGCWGKGHLLIIRFKKGIPKEDVKYIDKVLFVDVNIIGYILLISNLSYNASTCQKKENRF